MSHPCVFCNRAYVIRTSPDVCPPLCVHCVRQHDFLRSKIRSVVDTFLRKDPTTVVVSYLCIYDVMALCPLWGFLARISPRKTEFWGMGVFSHITTLFPECTCDSQFFIRSSYGMTGLKTSVINYDPRLYSDKPDSGPRERADTA